MATGIADVTRDLRHRIRHNDRYYDVGIAINPPLVPKGKTA
jgi:hypothetical protein